MSTDTLYTIGYQGRSFEEFLKVIRNNNISAIIDIRDNPTSRRKEFSKTFLALSLQKENLTYAHFKELGTPSNIRKKAKATNDHSLVFQKWERIIYKKSNILNRLYQQFSNDIICLLCYEREALHCHRSIVSRSFGALNNYKIKHL